MLMALLILPLYSSLLNAWATYLTLHLSPRQSPWIIFTPAWDIPFRIQVWIAKLLTIISSDLLSWPALMTWHEQKKGRGSWCMEEKSQVCLCSELFCYFTLFKVTWLSLKAWSCGQELSLKFKSTWMLGAAWIVVTTCLSWCCVHIWNQGGNIPRLEGDLELSRSFGDRRYRQKGLIAEPEVAGPLKLSEGAVPKDEAATA
jgi:hypothetical protein